MKLPIAAGLRGTNLDRNKIRNRKKYKIKFFFVFMNNLNTKIDKYFEKYNVNNLDPNSQEYFSGAVKIALNEYNLPVLKMATKFEVADSTVERWASGTAVPHPKLRQIILSYIAERI